MGSHAGHSHGPKSGKLLWVSLAVTLVFCAVEGVAGSVAHSLALLSDAGHNLTDAIALGLAAYAISVARKPSTARRTFGYHRVAILTALFNAATLIVIAVLIAAEAYHRLLHPQHIAGGIMIWVAAVAVLMNTVIAAALSGDAKSSLNSRAAFVHMAGDALSSLAVVIAGIVVHFTHWLYADPAVSLLIAAFIGYSAWGIVVDASDILLENTPRHINVPELVAAMKSVEPVCAVHDLHIWTVGDGLIFLSCHVGLPRGCSLEHCSSIIERLNRKLHDDYAIEHATIQTEVDGLCVMSEEDKLYCAPASGAHVGHTH